MLTAEVSKSISAINSAGFGIVSIKLSQLSGELRLGKLSLLESGVKSNVGSNYGGISIFVGQFPSLSSEGSFPSVVKGNCTFSLGNSG